MASIYDRIGDLRKRMPGYDHQQLILEFKDNLTTLMEDTHQKLVGKKDLTLKD
jgi:hypothetical protein